MPSLPFSFTNAAACPYVRDTLCVTSWQRGAARPSGVRPVLGSGQASLSSRLDPPPSAGVCCCRWWDPPSASFLSLPPRATSYRPRSSHLSLLPGLQLGCATEGTLKAFSLSLTSPLPRQGRASGWPHRGLDSALSLSDPSSSLGTRD